MWEVEPQMLAPFSTSLIEKSVEPLWGIEPQTFPISSGCSLHSLLHWLRKKGEPLWGIEPQTSSLPRKCSTTELQRLENRCLRHASGRRGSNPRPIAWKAIALPTELLPHDDWINLTCNESGQEWIRTTEVVDSGFTVRPIWPLWNLPNQHSHLSTKGYNTPLI